MEKKELIILSTKDMKAAEDYTCSLFNITSNDLIMRAGAAIYDFINQESLIKKEQRVLIICGPGNNGQDGIILAQLLISNGFKIKVLLLNEKAEQLNDINITKENLVNKNDIIKEIERCNIIIDAIFGIGLNKKITGLFFDVIVAINNLQKKVYSIDIASGLNGDNGIASNIAVKADYTFVMQNYKIGNIINDACDYSGKMIVLDIGIKLPQEIKPYYLLTEDYVSSLIMPRKDNTHKYDYGKCIIFGGNKSMVGAPILSSLAALRSGAGLSTFAIHRKYRLFFTHYYPEIILSDYRIREVKAIIKKAKALAVGIGLGRKDRTNYRLIKVLLDSNLPIVIDADGLFYLKKNNDKYYNDLIITPHLKELSDLLDISVQEIKENPLVAIKKAAQDYNAVVILKGPATIIADKEKTYFYYKPNSALATAGTGDVLTGIITSFLAQGYDKIKASLIAVVLHGISGELTKEIYGKHGVIASDIIELLPKAMKLLNNKKL